MIFEETALKGAFIITPVIHGDSRGEFFRFYCKKEFKKIGFHKEFVQFNHSINLLKGTLRGIHYQKSPAEEAKLIRCISGKVFDVIVDLRPESKTYLKHISIELSVKNKKMIFIPPGFAHGFQTLEDDTELIYHHSNFYSQEREAGVRYSDPKLEIKWPLPVAAISNKDKAHPLISDKI